jgi:hypothetical protein
VGTGGQTEPVTVTADDVMPEYHFAMRHSRLIAASPEATWRALHEVCLRDMPVARVLSGVRALPIKLLKRDQSKFVSRDLPYFSRPPVPVLVSHRPKRLILAGMRKPWQPGGGPAAVGAPDLKGLAAFEEKGWTKLVMEYRLDPHGTSTRLAMETRVWATDERTRRVFSWYWLLVRPGGGLLRRSMLKQVDRLARLQPGVSE